jgi:hypothetical protein
MTAPTDALSARGATTPHDVHTDDMQRIISDTAQTLTRLGLRLSKAETYGDGDTIKRLHKRILAIERGEQERESR